MGVVLGTIMEAGDRLANFVRNLLEFFQREKASLKTWYVGMNGDFLF